MFYRLVRGVGIGFDPARHVGPLGYPGAEPCAKDRTGEQNNGPDLGGGREVGPATQCYRDRGYLGFVLHGPPWLFSSPLTGPTTTTVERPKAFVSPA